MERLARSFSTTSAVDINKSWRRKVYDGSPDLRKDMKTARFGESDHHGRFWKIKKLFNLDRGSEQQDSKKSIFKSKNSGSDDEFENRLMHEIYKNLSASHELSSIYD